MRERKESPANAVLICGLGRLGEHCAVMLKELGIPVYALHDREQAYWETEGMPHLLDRLTVGDCRRHSALRQAGIDSCRAILLTTSDERVNITAALAARSLNPELRLVIRSSQNNLNELLDQNLGNMVALDMAELPAAAFSLAAIGDETVGLFPLEDRMLRVVERQINPGHRWQGTRTLHELNTRWRRILSRTPADDEAPVDFSGWDPGERIQANDVVTYVEFTEAAEPREAAARAPRQARAFRRIQWSDCRAWLTRLWAERSSAQQLFAVVAAALVFIHLAGVIIYKTRYPEISLLDAFNIATVLIFDGYSNMFAQLKLPFPIPAWLLVFSLLMTMSGAVVIGMVYAFLTARVLSARLQFRRRMGRIPPGGHVVVLGLGRLGTRVAAMLHDLRRPVAAAEDGEFDGDVLPHVPVVTGNLRHAIGKTNCARAASIVVLTDDDVTNLELALLAAQTNDKCNLVIRTDDAEFGLSVSSLEPRAHSMSTYALSAEAFAAAALGERVLHLIRIRRQTVLVTEYAVEAGDTLESRLLAEVTGGYGVVAILHQRKPTDAPAFFPSDDIRLEAGDRMVVLATMDGLQRVEHAAAADRTHRLRILGALSEESAFEAARVIARVSGCDLGTARKVMSKLPGTLETALYRHQAGRLVRELRNMGVSAEAFALGARELL